MDENKSILHELYVFSEWKPEPEYIQKPDGILPENISALWRWLKFFGPKKSLIDSVTAHLEHQQKWRIALGDEGKVIAVLTDNILEIRTKRSEYATIAARTTVSRDPYSQWRKLVWSPDCSFLVLAYGNGVVSFFDLTASNLFNIPIDCARPGGLECTDNTHAVADIIFMPLRVKDTKWNWEVLVVTYDGKLRGYLVSQTDGFKLHHTFRFAGGVGAVTYCNTHSTLYVAGVPRGVKDPTSPLSAGITAWRILNDDPFYKLSVVSDQLEAQLAKEAFQLYIPFVVSKLLAFIVKMVISPNGTKLVCLHCNGDISIWHLPLLRLMHRWPLTTQPRHDLSNPLVEHKPGKKDATVYHAADVNWWSNDEIILSRFSGAVSVCNVENMINILGKKPEFFQGSPQVTCAHDGAFMALECESNVLPAKKSRSDESMEVVRIESDAEDTMLELTKELFKSVLYAITDIETFQPKPRRITVVSRVYRLLGVKSTTPNELFSRKIESGSYKEALTLAATFDLDSDLVYQQQWRKNPVSTDAIQKYLSKVSKKIWAVHQCVDRLPETLPAAKELLEFGLHITNDQILNEINKDRSEAIKDPEDIVLEDLNAYTSELLRCRHVMLFYKERLRLYEAILKCEKSTYVKDEYDRLRSNSIVHSSIEIAKEGRIEALTCLWPHIKTVAMQLSVLEKLPETLNPIEYQHLLPTKQPFQWFDNKPPIVIPPSEHIYDWCRKEIFRSIWSSNWSEDATPELETGGELVSPTDDLAKWYDKRAREIEARSGLVSHALTLVTIATVGGAVDGLDNIVFHLVTQDILIYDINVEGVTLEELEKLSTLETSKMLMQMSTAATFVADLKQFVIPYLKRYEKLTKRPDSCLTGLTEFFESISVEDLSPILLVLQSPKEFELDVRTHLELAEKCIYAHTGTDQLDMACDLLDTILKETDGSISSSELVRRATEVERVVWGSTRLAWRGVRLPPRDLRLLRAQPHHAHNLLTRLARSLAIGDEKPTQQDWEKLLADILDLQATLFTCINKEQCYEIYASSLLTSGDAASIKLASEVLTCEADARRGSHLVPYDKSVELVSNAAKEYFNSSSSLFDPALFLARCCLSLIKDDRVEIQQELDLISALHILSAFDLPILPIQVRLCEDRLSLIEECLKLDSTAYLASHKLLKLAKLMRIAGDDEQTREGEVMHLVGQYALAAGAAGGGAAADAARRLAALRHRPAAPLLAHVASYAHADRPTRRHLYAAAVTNCQPDAIEDILRSRLALELEGLQQMGVTVKENTHLVESRWPSTDDEFADAITTPIIEKKDLVTPANAEKKIPLFNYLLDTFQNKFALSDAKSQTQEATERSVHCQEFYHSLYPEHGVSPNYYRYDKFSIPDSMDGQTAVGQSVLKWFYIQNCLENGETTELESEVVQKCAEEILYADTPLSVACMLRSTQEPRCTTRLLESRGSHSHTAVSCALYATLVKCNSAELRDNVYLTRPAVMAKTTLKQKNASEEQLNIIRQCIDKLTGMGELDTLKKLGYSVNGLLFNADEDYRREIIYRVARSPSKEHMDVAWSLARKYGESAVELCVQFASAAVKLPQLPAHSTTLLEEVRQDHTCHTRLKEALWPEIRGEDHNTLINYFTILKTVDEKPLMYGLTAAEHIKLLKKAKAVSSELDYKVLVDPPAVDQYREHMVRVMRPETAGLLAKLLRSLPAPLRPPLPITELYTHWLTHYFYTVPGGTASSKKWMQQYRQCTSYFSKLGKEDLLRFIANTCFSDEAIQRVPAGTRNLMIMQAVDYCQQEQENDYKFNKNEQTWAQVGQELTRWARFLENYHSSSVQAIIDSTGVPRSEVWTEIEKSHGSTESIVRSVSGVVLSGAIRGGSLCSLLQCLHIMYLMWLYSEIEKSHGSTESIVRSVSGVVLSGAIRGGALCSLLQCLHIMYLMWLYSEIEKSHGSTESIVRSVSGVVLSGAIRGGALCSLLQCLHIMYLMWLYSEIEKSHGSTESIVRSVSGVVLSGAIRGGALCSLLQCLHIMYLMWLYSEIEKSHGSTESIVRSVSGVVLSGAIRGGALCSLLQCLHIMYLMWLYSEIEKSHGSTESIVRSVSGVVLSGAIRGGALCSLLQCLYADGDAHAVLAYLAQHITTPQDMQTLISRVGQYHKEGVKVSAELAESISARAAELGLPPQPVLGVLALGARAAGEAPGDPLQLARFTLDLLRAEWPQLPLSLELTDEKLSSEEGRREVFSKFVELADTWPRKKALVGVLTCWPPARDSEKKSLHCEYLSSLLSAPSEHRESLVLIKLLMRRPVLVEQEVRWLVESVSPHAAVNALWIILLSKCEHSKQDMLKLIAQHKDTFQNQELEEDLIKEILDSDMFTSLVSTPLYSSIINYIISQDSLNGEPSGQYSMQWATSELLKANYYAEAGHLRLMAIGVPAPLRGFTQSILYSKLFNQS